MKHCQLSGSKEEASESSNVDSSGTPEIEWSMIFLFFFVFQISLWFSIRTDSLFYTMMPILDQSPAHHHHHGHGHQAFYHQQASPEQTGKMQLTLILPNGVPSVLSVDAKWELLRLCLSTARNPFTWFSTPMMDLLVQAASSNKLNPSGYSLVVLDSNQHVIHFKPNQTVGQIGRCFLFAPRFPSKCRIPRSENSVLIFSVRNCQLPQANGNSYLTASIALNLSCLFVRAAYIGSPDRLFLSFFSLKHVFFRVLNDQPSTQGDLAGCSFFETESSTIWSKLSPLFSLIICHISRD